MSRNGEPTNHSIRRLMVIGGAVLGAIALVVGVLNILQPPAPTPPSRTESTSQTNGPGEQSTEVETSTKLTVPETVRMESHEFTAYAGATYLLEFEVSTAKPEGSPGTAMYFGVNLACGGEAGGTTRSIGGTQNLVTGESVTLSNQFLLRSGDTELQSCRMVLSSPNEDAAARGTTVEVDVRWSVTAVAEDARELDTKKRLPLVVDPGESKTVFRETVPEPEGKALQLIGTLHLTTCTMVNGSTEGGEALCDEESVNSNGSSFGVQTRARLLGQDGEACDDVEMPLEEAHVGRHVHHQLLRLEQRVDIPESSCGNSVELLVVVENQGPAPLVVHGKSSSYIAVPTRGA